MPRASTASPRAWLALVEELFFALDVRGRSFIGIDDIIWFVLAAEIPSKKQCVSSVADLLVLCATRMAHMGATQGVISLHRFKTHFFSAGGGTWCDELARVSLEKLRAACNVWQKLRSASQRNPSSLLLKYCSSLEEPAAAWQWLPRPWSMAVASMQTLSVETASATSAATGSLAGYLLHDAPQHMFGYMLQRKDASQEQLGRILRARYTKSTYFDEGAVAQEYVGAFISGVLEIFISFLTKLRALLYLHCTNCTMLTQMRIQRCRP